MSRRTRIVIAAAVFLAIFAGRFEPLYVRIFAMNREPLRATLEGLRFRKTPGLGEFLEQVRRRTREGDSVALVLPMQTWDGYSYAYYRASYVLAGRRVVPLMLRDGPHPENGASADYVASWRVLFAHPSFEPVWSGDEGMLSRRRR